MPQLKSFMVWSIALFFTLVAVGNITDYNTNWTALVHVLSMDSTFKSPQLMWRAIETPWIQQLAYLLIIVFQVLVASLLWISGGLMLKWRGHLKQYTHALLWASIGLFLGFFLYFVGFIVIGGEWFAMWQSKEWNAVPTAGLFSSMILFVLLLINQS